MSATDELRRLLDERGIEYKTDDRNGLRETIWCGMAAFQLSPTAKMTMIVTPEQAIAAALGSGKLTTEQVEEAVYRNCKFYEGGEVDVESITDELNAALGSEDANRYDELFGTPERAARTICRQLKHFNICICDGCPVKPPNKECDSEYDALVEWLRGDAE